MMQFHITYLAGDIPSSVIGTPCFYYVKANGNYLYPDGSIQITCHQSNSYHGWYPTEEAARAAIDTYHRKEKNVLQSVTTAQLNILVSDAITELVDETKLFTAYDVTQQLRKENPTLSIDHAAVRELISADYYSGYMSQNGYTRELRNIANKNFEAFVYGPLGSDFSTYQYSVTPSPTVGVTPNRVVINATFAQITTN